MFATLKDVVQSNLFPWSGNQIEKESESKNVSRNEISDGVGKICLILELELHLWLIDWYIR